jgi:hypothetical protein
VSTVRVLDPAAPPVGSVGKPAVSLAKRAANQANAVKSTGPRTLEGKGRISGNAVRHGLRAEAIVLPHTETIVGWQAHHTVMVAALDPEGALAEPRLPGCCAPSPCSSAHAAGR